MAGQEGEPLFGAYHYGMGRDEIISLAGAIPCQDAPDNDLLLCSPERINFLGYDWQELFFFNSLRELQQILLQRENTNPQLAFSLQNSLRLNGWQPVCLETEGKSFDVLEELGKAEPNEAEKSLNKFEEGALAEGRDINIYFFPNAFMDKVRHKVKSWTLAIDRKAPEVFVLLTLAVDSAMIKIIFTAPLLSCKNALRYGQVLKRK